MPIYEYTCKACDKKFDRLARRMSGEHKAVCPECGSSETARTLSVFAVGAEGAKSSGASDVPMCGHCGGPEGSCAMG